MNNVFAKLSLLSLLSVPAFAGTPLVDCEIIDGESTVKIQLEEQHGFEAISMKTQEGYVLTFGLTRKFGDYDTYANVFLQVEKDGQKLFSSLMVGSRDEYGSFTVGNAHGRCDAAFTTNEE